MRQGVILANINEINLEHKLKAYYLTAILGVVFAVVGFSYNAWRLEVTEDNSNIRTASFEVLKELAEFEQLIFVAHYDKNKIEGNPRVGWVKIGLIVDLSALISKQVEVESLSLHNTWKDSWAKIANDTDATNKLITKIERVRKEIKKVLSSLN